jgi:hypothetical protein
MAEALDAHRLETIKQLDLRLQKGFKLTGRAKLDVLFDVFNVFNANPVLNLTATTGRLTIAESGQAIPTMGAITTILPPRIARLSGRLSW